MKRKTLFHISAGLVLLLSLPIQLTSRTLPNKPLAQTRETSIAKTAQLLEQSGYSYRKTGDNTWIINRAAGKKGVVLLAAGNEFVVVGIVFAEKRNMRVTEALTFRLLKLNHSADYVKYGFDDDDDLFVRVEARIRQVDLTAFRSMVTDVNDGADKGYEVVKPFLINP